MSKIERFLSDPRYQALDDAGKKEKLDLFFNKYVTQDARYAPLDEEGKARVYSKFMSKYYGEPEAKAPKQKTRFSELRLKSELKGTMSLTQSAVADKTSTDAVESYMAKTHRGSADIGYSRGAASVAGEPKPKNILEAMDVGFTQGLTSVLSAPKMIIDIIQGDTYSANYTQGVIDQRLKDAGYEDMDMASAIKNKDLKKAGGMALRTFAQSAPVTVLWLVHPLIGDIYGALMPTAASKYTQLDREMPELSTGKKVASAALAGTWEVLSEEIGNRLGFLNKFVKIGRPNLAKLISKEVAKTKIINAFAGGAMGAVGEGFEEYLSFNGEYWTDVMLGITDHDPKAYREGAINSTLLGIGAGGVQGGITTTVSSLLNARYSNIQSKLDKVEGIDLSRYKDAGKWNAAKNAKMLAQKTREAIQFAQEGDTDGAIQLAKENLSAAQRILSEDQSSTIKAIGMYNAIIVDTATQYQEREEGLPVPSGVAAGEQATAIQEPTQKAAATEPQSVEDTIVNLVLEGDIEAAENALNEAIKNRVTGINVPYLRTLVNESKAVAARTAKEEADQKARRDIIDKYGKYAEMSHSELQDEAKKRGLKAGGKSTDIMARLKESDEKPKAETTPAKPAAKKPFATNEPTEQQQDRAIKESLIAEETPKKASKYESMGYNALQKEAKKRGINSFGVKKAELIRQLEEKDSSTGTAPGTATDTGKAAEAKVESVKPYSNHSKMNREALRNEKKARLRSLEEMKARGVKSVKIGAKQMTIDKAIDVTRKSMDILLLDEYNAEQKVSPTLSEDVKWKIYKARKEFERYAEGGVSSRISKKEFDNALRKLNALESEYGVPNTRADGTRGGEIYEQKDVTPIEYTGKSDGKIDRNLVDAIKSGEAWMDYNATTSEEWNIAMAEMKEEGTFWGIKDQDIVDQGIKIMEEIDKLLDEIENIDNTTKEYLDDLDESGTYISDEEINRISDENRKKIKEIEAKIKVLQEKHKDLWDNAKAKPKLVKTEWISKLEEVPDKIEGSIVARRSDWDKSLVSELSGRKIVHVYWIDKGDGEVKPYGIQSAAKIMGWSKAETDRKIRQLVNEHKAKEAEIKAWRSEAREHEGAASPRAALLTWEPLQAHKEQDFWAAIDRDFVFAHKDNTYRAIPKNQSEHIEAYRREGWDIQSTDQARQDTTPAKAEGVEKVRAAIKENNITPDAKTRVLVTESGSPFAIIQLLDSDARMYGTHEVLAWIETNEKPYAMNQTYTEWFKQRVDKRLISTVSKEVTKETSGLGFLQTQTADAKYIKSYADYISQDTTPVKAAEDIGSEVAPKTQSVPMSRSNFQEQYRQAQEGKLPKGQIDAQLKLYDAMMDTYAKEMGITIDEAYAEVIDSVTADEPVEGTARRSGARYQTTDMPSAAEIAEAERQMAEVRAKYEGTDQWMKAPNGKPTKLNERQWLQVRTQNFKDWFGDWENDPKNASKVVDENGEPRVVYHGSSNSFSEFSKKMMGSTGTAAAKKGFWFAANPEVASFFAQYEDKNIYPVFLNIKALVKTNDAKLSRYELMSGVGHNKRRDVSQKAIREGKNGAMFLNTVDYGGDRTDTFVAFSPNQIKSATANVGTFSESNADIRFQQLIRGYIQKMPNGKYRIGIMQPNVTTGLHEQAHLGKSLMEIMANKSPAWASRLKAAEEWCGVKDGKWTTEAEEKFANGYVKFLADGSAPNGKLKTIFAKIKEWIGSILQGLADVKNLDVSNEMRGVYLSMLGISEGKRNLTSEQKVLSIKLKSAMKQAATSDPLKLETEIDRFADSNDLILEGKRTGNKTSFYLNRIDDGKTMIEIHHSNGEYDVNGYHAANNQEVMEQVTRMLGDTRYQTTDMPSAAEIAEAERQMAEVRAKYEGTDQWLKAPNGKKTNLNERQWLQVRTPNFLNWFGDWINDPKNASKLVDENGEPLIAHHGTNREGFYTFDLNAPKATDGGYYGRGIYFTFATELYRPFARGEAGYYGNRIIDAFLNIRNPFIYQEELLTYKGERIDTMGNDTLCFLYNIAKKFPMLKEMIKIPHRRGKYNPKDNSYEAIPVSFNEYIDLVEGMRKKLELITVSDMGKKYYSVIYNTGETQTYTDRNGLEHSYPVKETIYHKVEINENIKSTMANAVFSAIDKVFGIEANYHPEGYMTRHPEITDKIIENGHDGILQSAEGDEAVVFSPTQIKSATANVGTFSESNDIRYQIDNAIQSASPDMQDRIAKIMERQKKVQQAANATYRELTTKIGRTTSVYEWDSMMRKSLVTAIRNAFPGAAPMNIEKYAALEETLGELDPGLEDHAKEIKRIKAQLRRMVAMDKKFRDALEDVSGFSDIADIPFEGLFSALENTNPAAYDRYFKDETFDILLKALPKIKTAYDGQFTMQTLQRIVDVILSGNDPNVGRDVSELAFLQPQRLFAELFGKAGINTINYAYHGTLKLAAYEMEYTPHLREINRLLMTADNNRGSAYDGDDLDIIGRTIFEVDGNSEISNKLETIQERLAEWAEENNAVINSKDVEEIYNEKEYLKDIMRGFIAEWNANPERTQKIGIREDYDNPRKYNWGDISDITTKGGKYLYTPGNARERSKQDFSEGLDYDTNIFNAYSNYMYSMTRYMAFYDLANYVEGSSILYASKGGKVGQKKMASGFDLDLSLAQHKSSAYASKMIEDYVRNTIGYHKKDTPKGRLLAAARTNVYASLLASNVIMTVLNFNQRNLIHSVVDQNIAKQVKTDVAFWTGLFKPSNEEYPTLSGIMQAYVTANQSLIAELAAEAKRSANQGRTALTRAYYKHSAYYAEILRLSPFSLAELGNRAYAHAAGVYQVTQNSMAYKEYVASGMSRHQAMERALSEDSNLRRAAITYGGIINAEINADANRAFSPHFFGDASKIKKIAIFLRYGVTIALLELRTYGGARDIKSLLSPDLFRLLTSGNVKAATAAQTIQAGAIMKSMLHPKRIAELVRKGQVSTAETSKNLITVNEVNMVRDAITWALDEQAKHTEEEFHNIIRGKSGAKRAMAALMAFSVSEVLLRSLLELLFSLIPWWQGKKKFIETDVIENIASVLGLFQGLKTASNVRLGATLAPDLGAYNPTAKTTTKALSQYVLRLTPYAGLANYMGKVFTGKYFSDLFWDEVYD